MYKPARALVLKAELGLSKEEKQKESRLLPSVLRLLKCTCKKNHKYSQGLSARSKVQQPTLCTTLSQLPAEVTGSVTQTVCVFTPQGRHHLHCLLFHTFCHLTLTRARCLQFCISELLSPVSLSKSPHHNRTVDPCKERNRNTLASFSSFNLLDQSPDRAPDG